MTELNKKWYEGTLEKDKYYYAKDSSEGDCIVHINKSNEMTFTGWEIPYKPDQSNVLEPFKLRTELLAQVPSYEKWREAVDMNKRNAKLKELLRECTYRIAWCTKTGHKPTDDRRQKLFDEISEMLND